MHLTNKDLVHKLAFQTALPKKTVSRVLTALSIEIREAVIRGDTVTVHQLGRFKRKLFHSGRRTDPGGRLINRFINGISLRVSRSLKRILDNTSEMFDEAEKENI